MTHVKKAFKRCGHPNWALNRQKRTKNNKEEKVKRRGKVIIPYIKGTSENDIETIYKPIRTLKNIPFCKMKDKISMLDRCEKHSDSDYVGETERVLRELIYEHRVIDYKTAKRSASLNQETEGRPEENQNR